MVNEELIKAFERVDKRTKIVPKSEKSHRGVSALQKKIFGLCFWRAQTVKTVDELAQALWDIGASPSIEEGRKLVPLLDGESVDSGYRRGLHFTGVELTNGETKYKVFAYDSSDM